MKITWLSPLGEGWGVAYKLRLLGHKVVVVDFSGGTNGDGLVPKGDPKEWLGFAEKSDAVVVDANWPSRRTRRSYAPSDEVLDLQQLRHKGIKILGPVPTSELLENDHRYQRKVLGRLGIPVLTSDPDDYVVRCSLTRSPFNSTSLVFRYPLLGSPEKVQGGDLRVSLNGTEPVVATFLDPLHRLAQSIGYDGYLNIDLVLGGHGYAVVENVATSPRYPGAFLDFAHVDLLVGMSGSQPPLFSTAISIFDLPNAAKVPDEVTVLSRGFYGLNLSDNADGDRGRRCLGAVAISADPVDPWVALQEKVKLQLEPWAMKGYGFSLDVGAGVPEALQSLYQWGYLR